MSELKTKWKGTEEQNLKYLKTIRSVIVCDTLRKKLFYYVNVFMFKSYVIYTMCVLFSKFNKLEFTNIRARGEGNMMHAAYNN